jgi:N-sulfoglucosamine sulfohydrolase
MAITRRNFLKSGLAASACAATLRGALPREAPALTRRNEGRAVKQPNILYIIVEDIGPHLSCYGEPLVRTPNIDRLAAEGVRFAQVFATSPVCSASRSSLMTGAYQTFTGTHHHRTWPWRKQPLPPPIAHVCDWFRAAGYFTCNLRPAKVEAKGIRALVNGAEGAGKLDLNFAVSTPRVGDPFDGRDWNQRAPGQPFLAHITLMESHPMAGWAIARKQPPYPLVDPDKVQLPPYYPNHPVARDEYANYLDAIQLTDSYVGAVLARLEREGLADDTVVALSSDHGPLSRGKQFLYDHGLRIPLIVRFPDRRDAGRVDHSLVSGVDFVPTLLGLAGYRLPVEATHGRDIFADPAVECVFAARDRMDESIDRMRAVRTARYKYIRNYLPAVPYMQSNSYKERTSPTWNLIKELKRRGQLTSDASLFAAETKPIEELYDLEADPHEVKNLAADPAHVATLRELRSKLDDQVARYDRAWNFEDPLDIHRGRWGRLPEEPPSNAGLRSEG